MASTAPPPFQIHLEPDSPMELGELTAALAAIGHQFEVFAVEAGLAGRPKDAKLLVSSVKPGSIDIGLLPDIALLTPLLVPLVPLGHLVSFAEKLKKLFDAFKKKEGKEAGASVRDCDDAIAIAGTIANHGGTQSLNVHNGDIYQNILTITASEAQQIVRGAAQAKAELQFPAADIHQRVAMVWAGLDTDKPRKSGLRNPDKGRIDEIDPRPRPVFFEDQFSYLKDEMLGSVDNPYRKVYFVDVVASRVDGKVASYRIVGFHGTDDRDDGTEIAD